jgi:hypothetical protein
MGGMVQPDRRDAGAAAWVPLDRPGAAAAPPHPATTQHPAAPSHPAAAQHPATTQHPAAAAQHLRPAALQPPRPVAPPHASAPAPPPRPVPARVATHVPSGLFPGGGPRRPVYREPLPIGPSGVALGIVAGALWMTLFGLLAHNARQYAWATIVAALLAWPVLAVLARFGDRGVAVGAAVTVGVGLAAAGVLVMVMWIAGDWLLW